MQPASASGTNDLSLPGSVAMVGWLVLEPSDCAIALAQRNTEHVRNERHSIGPQYIILLSSSVDC